MKNNPDLPGGSLKSKPTWPNAFGCSATSAFCVPGGKRHFVDGESPMTEENTLVAEPTQAIPADFRSLPAKYQHALRCDDGEERCRFLKEAAEAGYIPAMCDYGLMCQDGSEARRWLREAACEGYVPAMCHYALACDDQQRRKRWLLEAARKGHVEAMYQYSLECDDAAEAFHWLREAALEGHQLAVEACALRCEEPERTPGRRAFTSSGKEISDYSWR
jgi:hypothetical protein